MKNILAYFEQTASQYSNKVAVAYKSESVTFNELKNIAKRYAYLLEPYGINKPIGVFANRTIAPVECFLGVLYSHNFYVPIDPDLPEKKLRMLIEDSQFDVIIGDENNREYLLRIGYSGKFISESDLTENQYEDLSAESQDPAYMIYTSGSTGKPKGVLKSHGAVISYITAYDTTFSFNADEVIGNQTPLFFDAAAKDIYLMIKTGATIEIIPTELFSVTTDLIEYLNEKKITFCSWVPTAISLVAQMCPFSLVKPTALKRLFFVGEVMPMKHLNKWREFLPDVEYVNLYGQSELAGICCYYRVTKTFDNKDTLPIGQTLSNCHIYLLDGDTVVRSAGQIGEMYIVSDALATEYYHDKDKTDASFIIKDFGDGPERCFKTGDLAQYDEEGNLVFAARTDFQIKHMGRRIELGEIEAIAGAMDEIDRCCCLYNSEKKKIVLFAQLAKDVTMTGVQLRSKMRDIITSYMLPNKVVVLENLPLNANGKIDRQILKNLL